MSKEFIKYIGNMALCGHSIAKYQDEGNIILEHEHIKGPAARAPGDVIGTKTFTVEQYDNLDIPEGVNTLEWMLDNLFNWGENQPIN